MYVLYTLCLLLGGLALLPHILWRGLRGATYHHDLAERLGYLPWVAMPSVRGCVWFHAASVGEVQGIKPIIASVHADHPTLPLILSVFTPAGKRMAQSLIPEALHIFVLPLDLPWLMRSLMRHLHPRALIVQETELWPNLLRAAASHGIPVALVNGRLSPRGFRRNCWIRPFMRRVLAHVTLFLVQSEVGAQRFQHLGADSTRVHVMGNTNIDRALCAAAQPRPAPLLAPLLHGRRVLVAGSTHEGEETILLTVYRRLVRDYPDVLLVLAPRHLERAATVVRHVQAQGCYAFRRSQWEPGQACMLPETSVLILDTMGELAALYSLCTVAFIGGSLVPIGGHNALEAAVFAKPLIFGPYMYHFPELAALLVQAGGALQVRDEAEFSTHLAALLACPATGKAMGEAALHALIANSGALERTRQAINALLRTSQAPRMHSEER